MVSSGISDVAFASVHSEKTRLKKLIMIIIITRAYIYICTKKIVIERTRDLIYLKFVATDFFPKIIIPSAGENSCDLA